MHINQVTAVLDTKLLQLDQQLQELDNKITSTADSHEQERLEKDKAALETLRRKMIKSKEVALRAHELASGNDEQRRARQRFLGLTLCGISLLGLIGLTFMALK